MSSAEVITRSERTARCSARRRCAGVAPLRQAAPTPQCDALCTPLVNFLWGRTGKRPSAALRSLELARLVRRSRALHLHASRSAERVITSAEDI